MNAERRILLSIAVVLGFFSQHGLAADKPAMDDGYARLVNACLQAGALTVRRDPETKKVLVDPKTQVARLALADSAKLVETVKAHPDTLTESTRNIFVGLAKLGNPEDIVVWASLLRAFGDVKQDDIVLQLAAEVAGITGLPHVSDEGMDRLRKLVELAIKGESLEHQPQARRLVIRDANKLKTLLRTHKELITPALVDTAFAARGSVDNQVLLRAIGTDLEHSRAKAFGEFLKGERASARYEAAVNRLSESPKDVENSTKLLTEAIEAFRSASGQFEKLRETPWQARTDLKLARLLLILGLPEEARTRARSALKTLRRVHEQAHKEVAEALLTLAKTYIGMGEYHPALYYHVQALPILWVEKDLEPLEYVRTALQLAEIEYHTGHFQDALSNCRSAREVLDSAKELTIHDHALEIACYQQSALALSALGHPAEARKEIDKAISIRFGHSGVLTPAAADLLLDYGVLSLALEEHGIGEYSIRQASAVYDTHFGLRHPKVAEARYRLGLFRLNQNDRSQALMMFQRALDSQRTQANDKRPLESLQAEDLAASALTVKILLEFGRTLEAHAVPVNPPRRMEWLGDVKTFYRLAAGIIDRYQKNSMGEEDPARFRSHLYDIYPQFVGVCLSRFKENQDPKELVEAFELVESGRAQVLLEALASSLGKQRSRVDPALRSRDLDLLAELRQLQQQEANASVNLSSVPPEDEKFPSFLKIAESLNRRVRETDEKLRDLRREMRSRYPALEKLQAAKPIDGAVKALNANEVGLMFVTGEEKSFILLLDGQAEPGSRLEIHPLPSESEIAHAVATLMDLAPPRESATGLPLVQTTDAGDSKLLHVRFARAIGAELFEILLAPVTDKIADRDLLLIPSGPLCDLAFSALVNPADQKYLIENHRIRFAPSFTVALALKQSAGEARQSPKQLWAVADPNYSAGTQRLTNSRREVEGIREILSEDQSSLHWGADATETTVRKASRTGELANCRYVHFAVHGMGSTGLGRLPGLLLSAPATPSRISPDDGPEWEDDGVLDLEEIATLRLNADLVVLSACRSIEGRMQKGEGIMGMARAFLLAGSRGVVCSLWSIEDENSSRLMLSFYAHLKAGRSAREALRSSQLEMIQAGEPPFYWAPWIVIGE